MEENDTMKTIITEVHIQYYLYAKYQACHFNHQIIFLLNLDLEFVFLM
jgi:hypothetical protein